MLVDIAMKALVDQPHAALTDAALHDIAAGQHGADERIVRVERTDAHLRRRHETRGIDGTEYLSPPVVDSAGRTYLHSDEFRANSPEFTVASEAMMQKYSR